MLLSITVSTRIETYLPPLACLAFQRNACPLKTYSFFMKARVLHAPSGLSFYKQCQCSCRGGNIVAPGPECLSARDKADLVGLSGWLARTNCCSTGSGQLLP